MTDWVVRLATRGSALAMAQAGIVADALEGLGVDSEVVPIVTTGDRDHVSPVATLTEVGAFVRSVQAALLDGRADIAVHSAKDMPVGGPPGLDAFYPRRATPWDVLCGGRLEELPAGAVVGTGSPRRSAQLRLLRPDLVVTGIRGNVETRLGKVESGEVAAVVLAEAGLVRLDLRSSIGQCFTPDEMVPAPAQAALALEVKTGSAAADILAGIEHPGTQRAIETERGLLAATGAGCRSALGALAQIGSDGSIRFDGFVEDEQGPRRGGVVADDPTSAVALLKRELGL